MTRGHHTVVSRRCGAAALAALIVAAPVSAQQPDAVAFAAWVGLARVKADSNDHGAAVAAWREAERIQPLTTDLQKELFWALSDHRPVEARHAARVVLAADPAADDVRDKAIQLASAAGDDAEVEVLARAGIERAPAARWTRPLGVNALRRRDYGRAVEWLRLAVTAADRSATDAPLLAIALSAAGDDRAAVAAWDSVAPDVWRRNQDWVRSRLQARIVAAWSAETRREADAWMHDRPDDDGMRRVLVAALQRHGEHAAALALAMDSAGDVDWIRTRARLAGQARRPDIARHVWRQLAWRDDATTADRLAAAEWFRTAGDEGEALAIARGLIGRASRCSDELLSLLFRLQSGEALSELADVMRHYPPTCPAFTSWTGGLIDRLMAVQRFAEAAEFAEPMALRTRASDDFDLAGQLRLWNGDAAGAIAVLLPLVKRGVASDAGLDAAIDALRTAHRSAEAWRLATRRIADPALDPARALGLAELGIDTGAAALPQEVARRAASQNPALVWHAQSVLAQALLAGAEPATALDTLERIPFASLDGRGRRALLQAQALVAKRLLDDGAAAAAVDVLTRHAGLTLPPASRALLARALVAAARPEDADREYTALAAGPDASANDFVAWSRIKPEGPARIAILETGHGRFPSDAALTLESAMAHHRAGQIERAAALARLVLASDGTEAAAWRIVIDHLRSTRDADFAAMARIPEVYAGDAMIVIELAERLGAPGASEGASATALRWLSSVQPASPPQRVARELARARLLNSRGHASAALAIVAGLVSDRHAPPAAYRFHAQLLGWSGRHVESLEAYDSYLALAPEDVEARREQARVAGWAQQFQRARRLYAAIDASFPAETAARVEGEAKRYFYAARWRDAERAYEHWLQVEPLSEEAAFEYAETLVAQGRVREAREIYDRLSRRERPHEMAHRALRLLDERAGPSAALDERFTSSTGYEGQRLLEWSETRGRVLVPVSADSRQTLALSGSALTFNSRGFRLPAYAGGAAATRAYAWGALDGSLSLTRGDRDMAGWQGHAAADVRLRHHLDLRLGVERTLLLENLASVRDGLALWGPRLALAFVSPDTDVAVSARAAWMASNVEATGGMTVRQRVRRGADEVRLVGGINHTGWRASDLRFFSPAAFTRADAGMEWTRWLRVPKFRMDRQSSLTVRYLAGADSRGELYHQPFARLALEHRRVAVETEASWITSRVYRSLTLQMGVRIGG